MSIQLSIPALIDQRRMGGFQWRVLSLCFLIALFDGFDTQAMAFTGPAILSAFKLKAGDLAPILTAGIVGMTVGAMLLGLVGDRIGRRPAAMSGVFVFGAGAIIGSAIGGGFLAWGGPSGFFLILAVPLGAALLAVLSIRMQGSRSVQHVSPPAH
ncbi:hypothetical protein SDC9_57653 [bioreactor metagenome]|uniref:Major facilitator superfamily (MFS) profile domain-containing protein n=1 Tax=bioreactor metagenome TaxID=1076179 RepID=A0A644X565_9ZZZZ